MLPVELGAGVRAFFTTREGGVSAREHASLNLGLAVEDEPRRVLANHDLLAREVGVRVAFGRQVHGADVLDVTGPPRPGRPTVGTGDALVSVRAGVALGVVVADCVPVLLADGERGVVATAHAGRAGLVAEVVPRVVARMRELGAVEIHAVVGPSICGLCYEVPVQLQASVSAVVPASEATTSWDTPSLDLPAGVLAQLRAAGVAHVQHVAACTYTDDRFYSHRRFGADGSRRGRFAGVVRLE
ncbi:MAG: peptidoglycan editing factor PgeF [Actinomycetota bacterium]|nr:peptidoglycan editing factor PgeF [Actinomycetota bacterium]